MSLFGKTARREIEFKGESAKGTYYFDDKAGRLARMDNKVLSKGSMSISAGGQEMQLEADQENSLKAKVVSK